MAFAVPTSHLISSPILDVQCKKGQSFQGGVCPYWPLEGLANEKGHIEQNGFIVFLAVQVKQILNKLKTELSKLHSLTLQPCRTPHGRLVEGYLLILVWTMNHAKRYWRLKGWLSVLVMSLPLQVQVRLHALTLTFSLSDVTISHH